MSSIRLLTGPELGKIQEAILEHYTVFSFQSFTKVRLNKEFFNHVPPVAPLDFQVLTFADTANREGWQAKLINAFLAEHPEHDAMLRLAFELGIKSQMYEEQENQQLDRQGLEQLVNTHPFLDVSVLLRQISRIERCVCRMEISLRGDLKKWGTGILVGPDRVMTNYHVVEDLIKNPAAVEEVICRFDYNVTADNTSIFGGRPVALSADPVLASSPYSNLDATGSPQLNAAWPPKHLDYALLKLDRAISDEPFGPLEGGAPAPGMAKRGFIPFFEEKPNFLNGGHVFIVQHPERGPKKIAFGFGKLEGIDDQEWRVRYQVNTLGGSSGSPCFNEKYQWVALHNSGDPSWNPRYNQGIPLFRIVEDLKEKGISLS